ncbi:hypothetical protein [Micromonospora pisi]|uniref:hypothetical protein n=1 Tax=Micromonospora pisi TaxID=589240 RepID=UPI000EACE6EC|nr:hypothetical protein [Micromonospora pisi]
MPASRAQRAATAERRRKAIDMQLAGATYDQIADELGYADRAAAHKDITRAMETAVVELRESVEVRRHRELQRLDLMWAEAWAVLKRDHVVVSHGKLIYDEREGNEGKPLLDDGPKLQAVVTLLKIQERRAKYEGLDAPTRVEAITIDSLDAEIARLTAELEATEAGQTAGGASA